MKIIENKATGSYTMVEDTYVIKFYHDEIFNGTTEQCLNGLFRLKDERKDPFKNTKKAIKELLNYLNNYLLVRNHYSICCYLYYYPQEMSLKLHLLGCYKVLIPTILIAQLQGL